MKTSLSTDMSDTNVMRKIVTDANLFNRVGQDGRHLPFVFLKKHVRYSKITFRLLIYVFLEHTSNGN